MGPARVLGVDHEAVDHEAVDHEAVDHEAVDRSAGGDRQHSRASCRRRQAARFTRHGYVVPASAASVASAEGIAPAAELRPRPSTVIVLTDGFTPWPPDPPRGIRVIVGLLAEGRRPVWAAPAWARTIVIDDAE